MQSSHWLHSSFEWAGLTSSLGQDMPLNIDSPSSRASKSQAPQHHLSHWFCWLLNLRRHGHLLCVPEPQGQGGDFYFLPPMCWYSAFSWCPAHAARTQAALELTAERPMCQHMASTTTAKPWLWTELAFTWVCDLWDHTCRCVLFIGGIKSH